MFNSTTVFVYYLRVALQIIVQTKQKPFNFFCITHFLTFHSFYEFIVVKDAVTSIAFLQKFIEGNVIFTY